MTNNEKYIVDMYVRYFGRAADAATIADYALDKKTSVILKNIIADADAEKAELSKTEFVNNAFQNLFGRNATTKEMSKYYKVVDAGKDLPINSIVKSAAKNDKKVYDNKIAVALKYAELDGTKQLDLSKISKGNLVDPNFLNTVTKAADLEAKIGALADNSGILSSFDGKTFVLTTSVDAGKDFVGTNKNDQFIAADDAVSGKKTLTLADSIDGGKGKDGLTIVTAGTIANSDFESNTIKDIEIIDIKSTDNTANAIKLDTTTATDAVKNNFKDVTDLHLTTTDTAGAITAKVNGITNVTATLNTAATVAAQITGDSLTTVSVKGGTANVINNTDASGAVVETLKSVTLEANKTSNAITGNAIDTLTLKNQTDAAGLTTTITNTKSTALTVNLNNVNSTTNSSVIAGAKAETITINSDGAKANALILTAPAGKTLNIAGDAKFTLGGTTPASITDIVSTNSKGVEITTALGTGVKFTGGAGADDIKLTANYTKAINMGAGDDTVTYAAAGTGGSINGGAGNDTLVVTAASAIAGLSEVSGFEVLRAIGTASHNAYTFKALEIGAGAVTNTFTNVAAGVGLTVLATGATSTTVTLLSSGGTADVFDLTLKSDAGIDAGDVVLAGVETININSVDTATATANTNKLELTAIDAKSIVVTGNTNIDFTSTTGATTAAKVTSFDASALEGTVTFISTNTTVGQAVTIKGATGNFVNTLTGNAANDTIIGGAGADILAGGAGVDTLTGGAGADKFVITAQSTTTGIDKITDFVGGVDKIAHGVTPATAVLTDLRTSDFSPSATLAGAAATATAAAAAAAATNYDSNGDVVLFNYNSKTYAVISDTTTAGFNDGEDILVDITGVTGTVTIADFIA